MLRLRQCLGGAGPALGRASANLAPAPPFSIRHNKLLKKSLPPSPLLPANNDFRCAIIKTIGSNEDMSMLEKNSVLEDRMYAFSDILKLMDTVQINHDDKMTKLNLSDGRWTTSP